MTRRVLVVEDDEILRWLMSEAVVALGHRVTQCANASDALHELGAAHPFDLVITDVHMPGPVDGLGLAQEIWSTHPEIPIIIVSGNTVIPPGFLPGNARFIKKPCTLDVLHRLIQELLHTLS